MKHGFSICGVLLGLASALAHADAGPGEMYEMRRWVDAKFQNAAPAESSGGIVILEQFDHVWQNCRVDRPLMLGTRAYRRGLFTMPRAICWYNCLPRVRP